jgi:hypothetical protein
MANRSLHSSRSPSPTTGCIWDVQDILAERTTLQGDSELLVVWKPSWIPKSNMEADGPMMRVFDTAPKIVFRNSVIRSLRILLPVEPGTVLQGDSAEVEYREAALTDHVVGSSGKIDRRKRRRHANATDRRDKTLDRDIAQSHPSSPKKMSK